MSKKGFSTEIVHKVYNDDTGEFIEVGPDADGTDLIEIRCVDANGNIGNRLCGEPEQMRLVAEAILKLTEKP
jgi:hypothetical protein